MGNTEKNKTSKKPKLSAEKKFQIFLEAQRGEKPTEEILRREGLYASDLIRIRKQVQEGAIDRLTVKAWEMDLFFVSFSSVYRI